MADFNQIFRILRTVAFSVASLFALAVIVLGALITNFSSTYLGGYFTFAAFAIAISVLTLVTLPLMLVLSVLRKGVFTSMVVIDVVWTWLLWIFWLAAGGTSSSIYFIGDCSRYGSTVSALCSESTALTAFAFLSWIILLVYNITLISLAFRQHIRGNSSVWTKDVTEVDFTAPRANTTQVVQVNPAFSPQYPPTHTGTSVFVPPTPGSYTQPQAAYPQAAYNQQAPGQQPYPQPQVNSPYAQPQATGSFTHPPTGASPYPQV